MKKRKTTQRKKEEIAEDWCFVCKDGGCFRICDYKDCLKVYHPECVGKDDSFLEDKDRWICNWHLCFVCHKASKFRCFCCTKSVCGLCVNDAEFVLIKGNKGFCNHCLKLVKLIEEDKDVDSDGGNVNFKERNTLEFLFMEYWEIINERENVTLDIIQFAYAHLKKGKQFVVESELGEIPSEEDDETLVSDYDDSGDEAEKRKRLKRPPRIIKRNVNSRNKELLGWGSKALIEFLKCIGKDTTKKLTQDDVTSIIMEYVKENNLFHPEKKKKVVCDASLYSVLRRKSVNKNKMFDLLEAHFAENFVNSEEEDDDLGFSSDGNDENVLEDRRRERNSIPKSKSKKAVQQTCFASIVAENMKHVYLRRSLVEEILKKPGTFEGKVVGSFVRVKSDPNDYLQKNSHQLLQVTGIKKNLTFGKIETEILLQISNRQDIPISMLSDEYFSEEECEDLRRKVKDGLHKNPTIVEFEQKVKTLHEDITNHWIARELAILQNRIDQANEKGWRREFYEYSERRQLLQTSSEQSRLLHEVPDVIGLPAETKSIFEDCLGDCKQRSGGSLEMKLKGISESLSNSLDGNGTHCIIRESIAPDPPRHELKTYSRRAKPPKNFSPISFTDSGDGDVTSENFSSKRSSLANDVNNKAEAINGNIAGKNREGLAAEEKQHRTEESSPEELPRQSYSPDPGVEHEDILQKSLPQSITEENHQDYKSDGTLQSQPIDVEHDGSQNKSDGTLQSHPIDVEQEGLKDEQALRVQVIELSDDEEEKTAVVTQKHTHEDPESSVWHCMSPNGETKGPFSLSLLKRWSDASTYALKFKVWKNGQSKDEAISMSRAIRLVFDPRNE